MNFAQADDDFKSTEMIRAENELDDSAEQAEAEVARLEESLAGPGEDEPATDEEIEAFKGFVTGPQGPPEWSKVVQRINAGELTWRELAEGTALRDPDVLEAMNATARMRLDVSETEPETAAPASGGPSTSNDRDWDGEDFSHNTYLT